MGSNLNGTRGFSIANITVGEAVQAGDIATIGLNRLGYLGVEQDGTPYSAVHGLYNTIATDAENYADYSIAAGIINNTVQTTLANGNIAIAYSDTSSNVYYIVLNQYGTVVKTATLVGSAGAVLTSLNIAPLTGGNFVISLSTNTTVCTRFAIYNNIGTQILAMTLAETGTLTSTANTVCGLSDGNFVLGWSTGSSSAYNYRYAIYNSTGTVVKVAAFVKSSITVGNQGDNYGSIGFVGGGFVLIYTYNTQVQFTRFTNAGVIVGVETSISSTILTNGYGIRCLPRGTDGSFVVYAFGSGKISIVNSSNTEVSFKTITVTGSDLNNYIACSPEGLVYIANRNTTANSIAIHRIGFDNTTVEVYNMASSGVTNLMGMVALSDGSVSIIWQTASDIRQNTLPAGPSPFANYVDNVKVIYWGATTYPYLENGTAGPCKGVTLVKIMDKTSVPAYMVPIRNASNIIYRLLLNKPICSPIGVYVRAGAVGEFVPYQFLGQSISRTSFVIPTSLDSNENVIAGQRMSITGNKVNLLGFQYGAPTKNIS